MIICSQEECTGCSACMVSCPTNAISMQHDSKGFLQPRVDSNACIGCKKCTNICEETRKIKKKPVIKSIVAISKNTSDRLASSSGGLFSEIANMTFNSAGFVSAAVYDDKGHVEHIVTSDSSYLKVMRGSKYVQSNLNKVFLDIKNLLEKDKFVLFIGCPCQVSGLKAFLNKDYDNLITLDFICHGVPSPKIWEEYIKRKTNNGKIEQLDFRAKDYGWNNYTLKYKLSNGTTYREVRGLSPYLRGFNSNLFLRDTCYNCKFKGKNRASDITLADAWHVETLNPEINDFLGSSLVLIHTDKGDKVIREIEGKIDFIEVSVNKYIHYNGALVQSASYNDDRDSFFKDVENIGVMKALRKYCSPTILETCKVIIKSIKSKCRLHNSEGINL